MSINVSLVEFTGSGHPDPARRAAALLVFTKSTRLTMSPGLFDDIMRWPQEKIDAELGYMANTIPSSWEFVDYTFMIEGVTRAYTHQHVRTRTASFAQQTMRVLDVSEGPGWTYSTGPSIAGNEMLEREYREAMRDIADCYKWLVDNGAKIEDARGILPTNINTNIVAKFNMRTFVELVRKRSSPRTQGEYREVLDQMIAAVRAVHPFIDLFVNRTYDVAMKELDSEIMEITDEAKRYRMLKLVDQLRQKGE